MKNQSHALCIDVISTTILSFLPASRIAACSRVCKNWRQVFLPSIEVAFTAQLRGTYLQYLNDYDVAKHSFASEGSQNVPHIFAAKYVAHSWGSTSTYVTHYIMAQR